uniref:Uncharacterized protein n=1 Tax=Rhipicephalus microplus TaxID=6941 RepID=A0A6G5AGG4_RHIMP
MRTSAVHSCCSFLYCVLDCMSCFSRVSLVMLIFVRRISCLLFFSNPDNDCSNLSNAIWCFLCWSGLLSYAVGNNFCLRQSNTSTSELECVSLYTWQFACFVIKNCNQTYTVGQPLVTLRLSSQPYGQSHNGHNERLALAFQCEPANHTFSEHHH